MYFGVSCRSLVCVSSKNPFFKGDIVSFGFHSTNNIVFISKPLFDIFSVMQSLRIYFLKFRLFGKINFHRTHLLCIYERQNASESSVRCVC